MSRVVTDTKRSVPLMSRHVSRPGTLTRRRLPMRCGRLVVRCLSDGGLMSPVLPREKIVFADLIKGEARRARSLCGEKCLAKVLINTEYDSTDTLGRDPDWILDIHHGLYT